MRGETVHTEWAKETAEAIREAYEQNTFLADGDSCPKCGADLDDGECEECERSAPLDFDQ